ncbi:MAG: hypothetical protein LC754_10460 [Acidobacteria bacterium]|nr:hypothetical protein [Acidobacteriota bacterium]
MSKRESVVDSHTRSLLVLRLIAEERIRQEAKWGVQHRSDVEWLPILIEEMGEVGKAITEGAIQSNSLYVTDPDQVADLCKELIDMAAVAVAHVEDILWRLDLARERSDERV